MTVQSDDICPVSWNLPPEYALNYKTQVEAIRLEEQIVDKLYVSGRCISLVSKTLLYPVSQKSVSTKWRIYKGKIWTPNTSPITHSISTNSMSTPHIQLSIQPSITPSFQTNDRIAPRRELIVIFISCSFSIKKHNFLQCCT